MRRLKRFCLKTASICLGIGAAWLVAEVTLRLCPQLMPVPVRLRHRAFGDVKVRDDLWVPDPYMGRKLPANVDWVVENFPHASFRVRTTDLGYKDIGFRSEERNGKPLAAVVGDSFAFAWGVPDEEMWTTLLGKQTGWNVLNFGLGGYGPPQYTRSLVRYALPLKPQLVLWMFFPNDFGDTYHFHNWLQEGSGDFNYWHDLERRSWYERLHRRMHHGLRAHSFAYDAFWTALRSRKAKRKYPRLKQGKVDFIVQWNEWTRYTTLDSALSREGWRWTQEALLQARDAARQAGAEFVVALAPFREEVYWHLLRDYVADWEQQNPDGPNDLVKKFCLANGIRVVDLTPALRQHAKRGEQLYFSVDGHWNAAGNRVVAEAVAKYLKAEGLLPAASPKSADAASASRIAARSARRGQ